MFALPEAFVIAYLESETGDDAGTTTPNNLETLAAFHRVSVGGGDDDTVTDSALVDIESFAPSRYNAALAAERARLAMLQLSGKTVAGSLVDRVRTATRPVWLDYDNPKVFRYVATYRVEQRA